MDGAKSRSDVVKNISLTLLSSQTPQDVLEIFSREILQTEGLASLPAGIERTVHVEELLIALHFFKAHLRELHEADIKKLIEEDFRVKQLISMVFDKYSKSVEFTY